MKISKLVLGFMILGFASEGLASGYLVPKAGMVIPLNGNEKSFSLGAGLGYEWLPIFSTEFSYSHLMGTGSAGDGDMMSLEGILHVPLPILSPYATGGVGLLHSSLPGDDSWDSMLLLGAGVNLTALPIINVGVGITYAAVKNKPDFIQPVISASLNF